MLIQSFFQKIPATAFTTTSFTWWPGATKFISVAVQPFHLFRLSACPSCVRLCRVCLFGFRLVYRDMFSPSPANGRRFDQLSPLSNPTQSPALAFMGFSLDLVRSKGGYIFGQGTLFWICAFISVFSKMWAY